MLMLARLVRLAAGIAIVLILAGIALHLLDANMSNGVVSAINDAAKWLVQPFNNVFSIHGNKARIAVNWGLAALVYAIVAGLIVRLVAQAGTRSAGVRRRRGAVV